MKKTLAVLSLMLALALPSAFGQATATSLLLTATSLASAVKTTSTTTFTLTSSTGVVAGSTVIYVDDGNGGNGEAVFVNSVGPGGQVGVTRGYNGSQANLHLSGSVVLFGPPAAFTTTDPSGSCTANLAYTPTVNILGGTNGQKGGNQWICSTISASWVPGFFNTQRPAGAVTALAASAGANNPPGPLFHVTGSTPAITAWGSSTTAGLGAGGGSHTQPYGANFCVIPDTAYTTTATNNIGKATTAVVSQVQCWTWDATNKVYQPSY